MKKMLAIALALMLVPFTAFGLEILEDSTLDSVTGQAGVSIATDVIMDVHFDTVAWGDSDGIDADATDSEGWVGITDLDITNLRIKIRDDLAAANFSGASGAAWTDIQLFTIDVATDTEGTYVHMLLGTQQVTFDTMDGIVELGADTNLGDVLGSFYIGGFELLMAADSYVDIRAHGDAGVTIDFGVVIDSITMDAMSWGDQDGLGTDIIANMMQDAYDLSTDPSDAVDLDGDMVPDNIVGFIDTNSDDIPDTYVYATNQDGVIGDYTDAGYVGLSNASITGIAASGSLLIDVATMDEAAITGATMFDPGTGYLIPESYLLYVYVNMLNANYDGSETAVLLQFENLTASMATFSADVVLDATQGLNSASAATLGSLYAAGMNVTLNGWVGIFAH